MARRRLCTDSVADLANIVSNDLRANQQRPKNHADWNANLRNADTTELDHHQSGFDRINPRLSVAIIRHLKLHCDCFPAGDGNQLYRSKSVAWNLLFLLPSHCNFGNWAVVFAFEYGHGKNAWGDSNSNADSNTNPNADSNADTNPNSNSNSNSNPDSNSNSNSDSDSNADSDASADANASSYANADANSAAGAIAKFIRCAQRQPDE
jgi:hypothetical protein